MQGDFIAQHRVQVVLEARRAAGGTGSASTIITLRVSYTAIDASDTGTLYFDDLRLGRQEHTCDLAMLSVPLVEAAVLENSATVGLPTGQLARITALADWALSESSKLRKQLMARLTELDRKAELAGDPDWPQGKIGVRLRKMLGRAGKAKPAARRGW